MYDTKWGTKSSLSGTKLLKLLKHWKNLNVKKEFKTDRNVRACRKRTVWVRVRVTRERLLSPSNPYYGPQTSIIARKTHKTEKKEHVCDCVGVCVTYVLCASR